ncbi:hypothetical protein AB0N88_20595 [Streptomyces sp. NPDC093516]|uniref:hypothetical protein n=1 Tax=Streptomyces sp. NPDC093516 TaxID=3155304 RepID=UPI00342B25AD
MATVPDDEPWEETERAVRGLLERAVPDLASPADRMAGIRRKVRRRRQHAVATACAAVTALAALVFVLPGLRDADPALGRTAAPSDTSASAPARSVRLLGTEEGVQITLPKGWYALSVDDARGGPVAFIASVPLAAPADASCSSRGQDVLGTCRPVVQLPAGNVLVVLRDGQQGYGTATPAFGRAAAEGCKSIRSTGKSELRKAVGTGPDMPDTRVLVEATTCQRTPVSAETLDRLQHVLDSITAAGGGGPEPKL